MIYEACDLGKYTVDFCFFHFIVSLAFIYLFFILYNRLQSSSLIIQNKRLALEIVMEF